jgi:hypothetical protein
VSYLLYRPHGADEFGEEEMGSIAWRRVVFLLLAAVVLVLVGVAGYAAGSAGAAVSLASGVECCQRGG